MREMDWRWLVPADFLLLQLIIWFEPRITLLLALRAEHSLSPGEFTSVGSDCPRERNVCDFSCCPLVLCCAVCRISSFSCLLNNWMRCKSECWTLSSNMGGRSGWPRNCCKHCQPPQNSIKTRIVLEPYSWLPDFRGHWSFCLLEGTADINHCEGRLRVLGAALLLERLQSVFLQHGAIWHETQWQPDGGAFLKGKVTQSCVFSKEKATQSCVRVWLCQNCP